ncbi:MAG TPA: alpha/beta fold hydrolase [Actinomycetota bacterium]|nr:alpha/beta fold hydrolase [Actinomycetota bacterium]
MADGPDPQPQAGRGRRRARRGRGHGRRRRTGPGGGAARPLPGRAAAGGLRRRRPPAHRRRPGPLRFASFPSEQRGRPVGYGVAWPPGSGPGDRLPVCLLLHAAAGDERAPFQRLRLHHHLAQAVGAGGIRPFALASADGRGSGWRPGPADDPFGMLLEELAPLLSGLGLRTGPGQLGVLGWSMGGAGALRLAEAHPGRLAAVVATSPAIAETGSEVAGAGRLTGLAVKVDCGANDPFAPGARALATTLPVAQIAVTKGCHDGRFWQEQAPAQLRFLAAALSA